MGKCLSRVTTVTPCNPAQPLLMSNRHFAVVTNTELQMYRSSRNGNNSPNDLSIRYARPHTFQKLDNDVTSHAKRPTAFPSPQLRRISADYPQNFTDLRRITIR